MKKAFGVIVLAVIFLASISTAYCSDTEYKIPELNMTVTLPDDYIVLTRDTAEDDPGLAKLGANLDELKSMFEQRNIYVNAVQQDITDELVVTMTTNKDIKTAFNLKNVSEQDMQGFLSAADEVLAGQGATVVNTSEYKHKQAYFVVFDFTTTMQGIPTNSRMYSTIINGQFINFTLHSFTGMLSNSQADLLAKIVDSAVFVEQSSFDWTYVIVCGVVGAIAGGTIGLIKNRQKKKLAAIAAQSSASEPPVSE